MRTVPRRSRFDRAESRSGRRRHRQGTVSPGVFDDTPVFDRRPMTAEHIHALRTFSPGADQLYIVFSVSGGAEVLVGLE
ncbi:hypothetical protein ABZ547_16845 [Streptomyces sparsogenes]|uniref:hypothetical protein n=1 Tax=Streptomyces sparsogenes TaxID=67365 RepID=UPI0033C85DE3